MCIGFNNVRDHSRIQKFSKKRGIINVHFNLTWRHKNDKSCM